MIASPEVRITLEAHYKWENAQAEKHELHLGEVFSMPDGQRVHGRVVGNIACRLGNQFGRSRCRVSSESMKVQIDDDTVLYPDVFVTRDPDDLSSKSSNRTPAVVAEILSSGIQSHDHSQRFALYRRVRSLQDYGLVDPGTHYDEGFRRDAPGKWMLHQMSDGPPLEAASVDAAVSFNCGFDGIDPPADD